MSVLKVTCVGRNESDADDPIRAIGGDGFFHTVDQAVESIASRTHQYWTESNGQSVWIEIGIHPDGSAYLKAPGEDFPSQTLLALEGCEFTPEETASIDDDLVHVFRGSDGGRDAILHTAERMALRTVVRMLVLNRYGRDQARLDRNRDDAIKRISASVENTDVEEDTREKIKEAVSKELHYYFASPTPKPPNLD